MRRWIFPLKFPPRVISGFILEVVDRLSQVLVPDQRLCWTLPNFETSWTFVIVGFEQLPADAVVAETGAAAGD